MTELINGGSWPAIPWPEHTDTGAVAGMTNVPWHQPLRDPRHRCTMGGAQGRGGGGATTTGPDATPPRAICQNLRGGGGAGGPVGGGGRLEGVGGVRCWGGGSQGGGAYARPTTTKCIPAGGMCVWGGFGEAAGGCCEAGAADGQVCPQMGRCVHSGCGDLHFATNEMDGLMKGKHAQKNFGAVGAMAPTPLSLKTQGGGGVLHTRTGPGRTPVAQG